jgi:hypothetical protein
LAASIGFGLWWLWTAGAIAPTAAPRATPAPPPVLAPPAQDAGRRVEGTVTEPLKAEAVDAPAPEASAPAAAEAPAAEPPAAQVKTRPAPRLNSPDARCAEIIARVSLGEELSAAERAYLQGECRK